MSRILVIAPHADDEVLGAGGTISRFAAEGHDCFVAILTGHGPEPHPLWPRQQWDIVRKEATDAHRILGVRETIFAELPAVLVPEQPIYHVNKVVGDIINQVEPTMLFVPFLYDLHRDHRELVYSASVAWRPTETTGRGIREIYMYETLSETHWNIHQQEGGFLPNVFVHLSEDNLNSKLKALGQFESQIRDFPDARSLEGVEALAKFRGCSVGVPAAEAFVLVRQVY